MYLYSVPDISNLRWQPIFVIFRSCQTAPTVKSVIIDMLSGVTDGKWQFSFLTLTLDVQRVTRNITRLIMKLRSYL